MLKAFKKYLRYRRILKRIKSKPPKCNPDNGFGYTWYITFDFHTQYNLSTGEKLKQKYLPHIRIEAGRFSIMLEHPTIFKWGPKQIVENRWVRLENYS